MRYLFLLILILPSAMLANPGETACQRFADALNNFADRSLTTPQQTTAADALNYAMGGAAGASNATKCTNGLTFLHQAVKQAVVRHKESQLTPQTSTEVE